MLSVSPAQRGAALIVAAMALIGLADNLVGLIAAEIGVWQFHLLRAAIALPALALAARAVGAPTWPRRPWRVAARSGTQAAAMLLYYGSLSLMPVAQAGAGLFTAPLFVLLFSAALFGHRVGPRRILAVAIGFAGCLLVLRPDFAAPEPALLMPVAAGALYGASNLLTREWCAEEPVAALLGSFFVALALAGAAMLALLAFAPAPPALAEAAPFLTRPWVTPAPAVLGWTAFQAIAAVAAVAMTTRGYQSAETSYLAVFEYSFLVSASFWGWVLWDQPIDAVAVLGIAMIFTSGVIIAVADRAAPTDAHSGKRRPPRRPEPDAS